MEKENEIFQGRIKDFSRWGIRCIFDNFDFSEKEIVNFKIQRPNRDIFIPFRGEIVWKKETEEGWEVGINIKNLLSSVKSEILEFCYQNWVRSFQ
ncbi:MAG: hypothetical protein DRP76_03445 [Candidatus Omnitrophota bacterium]|nr:MAG: hypothetical protein DRP76_03445 [Candidatus Omnitrophota bacterium]